MALELILLGFDYLIVEYVHGLLGDGEMLQVAGFHDLPVFAVVGEVVVVGMTLGEVASGAAAEGAVVGEAVRALVDKPGEASADGSSLDGGLDVAVVGQAALFGVDDAVVVAHVDD